MTTPDTSAAAWMPFYIGDYLRDTGRLSTEEHGAYLLLLLEYWTQGPLPDDDTRLARVARATSKEWRQSLRPVLQPFFRIENGTWRHKRADAEREKAMELIRHRTAAGRRGAQARWQKREDEGEAPGEASDGKRMVLPCSEQWQTDAQPQPQSQPQPPPLPKAGAAAQAQALAPAGAVAWDGDLGSDDALHIVWSFHALRQELFGTPPPAVLPPREVSVARDWVRRGALYEPVRAIMEERLKYQAKAGKRPPATLQYFQAQVLASAAAGDRR
jgi:uncharacterized protein YdaU (DUF1376 family)